MPDKVIFVYFEVLDLGLDSAVQAKSLCAFILFCSWVISVKVTM